MPTQMPTPIALTSGNQSNVTSFTTASVSLTPGQLILLVVFNKGPNSTSANLPSLSGISVSWQQIVSHQSSFSSGEWRITFWVGVVTSVTSGTLTGSFSGQSQQSIAWFIGQVPKNVKLNTSAPQNSIVQSNTSENNSTVTSQSVSLSAFANINNATFSAFADDGQSAFSGTQTDIILTNLAAGFGNFIVLFSPGNDTNPTATMTGNNSTGKVNVAAEISFHYNRGGFIL